MQHKMIAVVLLARLALAPGAAADEPFAPPRPLTDAAAREAVRVAQAVHRGPMPAGLKWTGIGLIIGSGLPVVGAALSDCFGSARHCRTARRVQYGIGGAMAGTGVLLLMIGDQKRSPAMPSLTLEPGRAVITQRITF